jgi:hypothetical protein
MATLEEEIKDLKAKIAEYEQEYANASTSEERKELRPLITAKEARLLFLLQQQQQDQAGGGQGTIDNATAIALTAAMQESTSVNRELTAEMKIRRGAGSSRGSSYLTPPSGQETPDEVRGQGMAVSGVAIRGSDEKRYAGLFRACLREHNSDCNVKYSKFGFKVMKGDSVIYACPFAKKPIKNAYALFRLTCQNNINNFERALRANEGVVPDFDGETPPSTSP